MARIEEDDERVLPVGTVLDAKYRLERFLGAGAMGAVYEATRNDGSKCAVKTLVHMPSGAAGEKHLSRFFRETRICSELDSPNVVRVFEGGVDAATGVAFCAMELLHGMDLADLVRREGELHPTTAVRIAIQACRGVAAAHAAGVVHRDIKPPNIFLHEDDDGKVTVKVCDFGIAKAVESSTPLTHTGMVLGSPLYMSPEQAVNSKNADARSDVWSLAVTLYEMLCADAPLRGMKTFPQLLLALKSPQPPLQERAPWIDPALAIVVHGALIEDRDARCPNVQAFAEALMPFAGEGGVEISRAALVGVPDEIREQKAPLASLPNAWTPRVNTLPPPRVSNAPDPLVGALLGGRFRLLRPLGRGGMGAVYEAEGPEGRVAVKVIREELITKNRAAHKRFMREARASMAMKSPHVVRMLEVDTDLETGAPFIVMELLTGADLDVTLKRVGPLEPELAARIFVDACAGIEAAHAMGIVHRDIKPANIFLHELASGEIAAKICDFGIAKITEAAELEGTATELTHTGGVLGSPTYMSPEQARNAKNVDARSDVWSLALTLREALTGEKPWRHCTSMGEIILAICTEHLGDMHKAAPWVGADFVAAVRKGTQKVPEDRYASMLELAAALEPLAQKAPVHRRALVPLAAARRAHVDAESQAASADTAADVSRSARGAVSGVNTGDNTAATGATAMAIAPPVVRGRSSRLALLGAAAVAAIAALGVGVRMSAKSDAAVVAGGPSASAPLSVASSAQPAIVKRTAQVSIVPPSAVVTVGGVAATLHDGALALEGEPGEGFVVVAQAGGARIETQVTLTRDGQATPSRIVVPNVGAALATTGTTAASAAPRVVASARASASVAPAASVLAIPAPTGAAKPATPATTPPKPKENWE